MSIRTLTVGRLTVIPLSDGSFSVPPAMFMPAVPSAAWTNVQEYLDADGNVALNVGSYLIREGDTWTLVDTGVGPRAVDYPVGKLLHELQQAGVAPGDIGRVIITHLHFDHVGWNTRDVDGAPEVVFANARHIVQQTDWDCFTLPDVRASNPHIALSLDPVQAAGLWDFLDGSTTLSDGISTILTPGHTPGHQSVLLASEGEKAVILGDVSHSPAQIVHPDWNSEADQDPDQSARTRVTMFDRIEQEGLKVCAGHYAAPGLGGIVRVTGKRRWQPL